MPELEYIFIIDDDRDDQELLIEAIVETKPGVACFTANNGKVALDMLFNNEIPVPSLIFLDLNMPKINGKQTLEQLKKKESTAKIPVVIYSTSSYDMDVTELTKMGAEEYWVKDSDYRGLRNKLLSLFQSLES